MYHVLNYSDSQFEGNPSTHSQIIYYIVSVALAVALSVYMFLLIRSKKLYRASVDC